MPFRPYFREFPFRSNFFSHIFHFALGFFLRLFFFLCTHALLSPAHFPTVFSDCVTMFLSLCVFCTRCWSLFSTLYLFCNFFKWKSFFSLRLFSIGSDAAAVVENGMWGSFWSCLALRSPTNTNTHTLPAIDRRRWVFSCFSLYFLLFVFRVLPFMKSKFYSSSFHFFLSSIS